MRKIKFRGMNNEGQWIYGSLLQINFSENYIYQVHYGDLDDIDFGRGFKKVTNVGQYTGITDKNGIEIYEGDIVRGKDGEIGKVVFDKGAFFGAFENEEKFRYYDYLSEETQVLGNIYENPELLKKEGVVY